jgi:hypothetical protein
MDYILVYQQLASATKDGAIALAKTDGADHASVAHGVDPEAAPLAAYRAGLWVTAAVLALAWLHFDVRRR